MSTTELQARPEDTTGDVRVHDWRLEQLRLAGYPAEAAAELARRTDIDLHLATRLLQGRCDPGTALRILV